MTVLNKKKKKRISFRQKFRIFIALIVFGTVTFGLGYNLFMNVVNIKRMKSEKNDLKNQIVNLEEEKKELEEY